MSVRELEATLRVHAANEKSLEQEVKRLEDQLQTMADEHEREFNRVDAARRAVMDTCREKGERDSATIRKQEKLITRLKTVLRETLEAEGSEIPHNVAVRARAVLEKLRPEREIEPDGSVVVCQRCGSDEYTPGSLSYGGCSNCREDS